MLGVGDSAPDFSLPDANGDTISLADFSGKRVLLWFFPRASTPGCTVEGCGLRDHYEAFASLGVEIVGMSADSPRKQKNFVEKHAFPYTMLCDQSHATIEAYGAWGLKKFMGREYDGIHRISYLISAEGKIEKVFAKVKTKSHAEDVLRALRS